MNAAERDSIVAEILAGLVPVLEKQRHPLLEEVRTKNRVHLLNDESPLGVEFCAGGIGELLTCLVIPNDDSEFLIKGVRSFNDPGDIDVVRIASTAGGVAYNANTFDSATYSLARTPCDDQRLSQHRGYFEVPWGMISREHPLFISFMGKGFFTVSPHLRWTLYGVKVTSSDRLYGMKLSEDAPESSADADLGQPWGIPQR